MIVDLLLNQTACGYNIIEETKRILRRGSKVIFLFYHWVRIRQTKTNFNRQKTKKLKKDKKARKTRKARKARKA